MILITENSTSLVLLLLLLLLLLLPNTGLDSKDRVGIVPELCALCTWTIKF